MAEKALQRMTSTLGYERVTLWVLTDNLRARNFYEKLGFGHDNTDSSNIKRVRFGTVEVEEMRYDRCEVGKSGAQESIREHNIQ